MNILILVLILITIITGTFFLLRELKYKNTGGLIIKLNNKFVGGFYMPISEKLKLKLQLTDYEIDSIPDGSEMVIFMFDGDFRYQAYMSKNEFKKLIKEGIHDNGILKLRNHKDSEISQKLGLSIDEVKQIRSSVSKSIKNII